MGKHRTRLSEVLGIQSSSDDFLEMWKFVKKRLEDLKVEYTCDKAGNIFAKKGEGPYPAFACHTDTVHDHRSGYQIDRLKPANVWFAYYTNEAGRKRRTGIGGDDKCGVFICLRLLEALPKVKVAFYAQEEMGCVGSERSDVKWYEDCLWVIQCDRKGNSDIVVRGSGVELCGDDFADALERCGKQHNYKLCTTGGTTDVVALKREKKLNIACANISVGYYRPHSVEEHIVEADVFKALMFCTDVATKLTRFYPHVEEKKLLSSGKGKIKDERKYSPSAILGDSRYERKDDKKKVIDTCVHPGCTNVLTPSQYDLCTHCEIREYGTNGRRICSNADCKTPLVMDSERKLQLCLACISKTGTPIRLPNIH